MTDKQGVSFDNASIVVKLTQQEGAHRLLQSEVQSAVKHMTSTMDSITAEVRRAVDRVGDVSSLQQHRDQDRESMSRIERTLVNMDGKIDARLDRYERENSERWLRHEADNENSERGLQCRVDDLDRKMIRALAWVSGCSATAALLLGVVVYAVNMRFDNAAKDASKVDPLVEKVHNIELYLAREGRPPQKEKP